MRALPVSDPVGEPSPAEEPFEYEPKAPETAASSSSSSDELPERIIVVREPAVAAGGVDEGDESDAGPGPAIDLDEVDLRFEDVEPEPVDVDLTGVPDPPTSSFVWPGNDSGDDSGDDGDPPTGTDLVGDASLEGGGEDDDDDPPMAHDSPGDGPAESDGDDGGDGDPETRDASIGSAGTGPASADGDPLTETDIVGGASIGEGDEDDDPPTANNLVGHGTTGEGGGPASEDNPLAEDAASAAPFRWRDEEQPTVAAMPAAVSPNATRAPHPSPRPAGSQTRPGRDETDPGTLRPKVPESVIAARTISSMPSRSRRAIRRVRALIGLVLVVLLSGVGLAAAIGAAVLLVVFALSRAFGSGSG